MVFQALLGSSNDKGQLARSKSSTSLPKDPSDANPTYIQDEEQLQPLSSPSPDLRNLNTSLEALAVLFPDVQIEVFREMLANFDNESRLAVVADALLKNRVSWVKGRWRVAENKEENAEANGGRSKSRTSLIPNKEVFKSTEYKGAVKALAWQEFRGLPRSTIHAVLAEHNYSYLDARKTLVQISSKSWRFTISSLFSRRRPVTTGEAGKHPLIVWKPTPQGVTVPTLRSTGNGELDRELYDELISPLKVRERTAQEEKDRGLAILLNTKEAEEMESLHECCCCFSESAFEEFVQCSSEWHMICYRCVQLAVAEAVFGQGWHSSIDVHRGTLRCLAVEGGGCAGHVPQNHLQRAMLEEKRGAEILHKLDQRLAEHSILSAGMPLVRCPFCDYAEIDDVYLASHESQLRLRRDSIFNMAIMLLCLGTVPFVLPAILISTFIALLLSSERTLRSRIKAEWALALHRHRRRHRTPKFVCQSPNCGRASCLSCSKAWHDIHVCNESSLVALRTQVEQAMSMAIKRVCPRCGTSFVKNSGCNKLTCPCGYKMCYVCRKDIGGGANGDGEGYRHFCDHFRPHGDPRQCQECDRCNLWESEDTDAVLQAAKEEAERKWRETEKRELSSTERSFLETGFAAAGGSRDDLNTKRLARSRRRRWPSVPDFCDIMLEMFFY